jgi:MFS family permease
MEGLLASWRVSEFRALLLSYAVNRTGDLFGEIALAVAVFDRTGSAATTATLFLATQFVPGLLGPFVVSRIDRVALGRLLPWMFMVEAGLFGVLGALAAHGAIWLIVPLALIDATLAFCARALTRSGAASVLTEHDLLSEGKAAFNAVFAGASVLGPVAAAALVALINPGTALWADGATFVVAALVLERARGLRAPVAGFDVEPAPLADRQRFREGLRYVWRYPALRLLLAGEGLAFVFFYFVVPVTVIYAERTLHAGAGGYGAILASWGVGMVVGAVLQIRLARRVGVTMILVTTLMVALSYIGTALAPTLAVACFASVIGGVGNGTQWATVETAVHQLVAEAFRARTAAVLEAMASIAPGVGIVAGGVLAGAWSPRGAYLIGGLGVLAIVAVAIPLRGPLSAGWAAAQTRAAAAGARTRRDELEASLARVANE